VTCGQGLHVKELYCACCQLSSHRCPDEPPRPPGSDHANLAHPPASAVQHPSSRVMLAALKFFLGQDEVEEAGSDDDEPGGRAETGAGPAPTTPSRKDVYSAKSKVGLGVLIAETQRQTSQVHAPRGSG